MKKHAPHIQAPEGNRRGQTSIHQDTKTMALVQYYSWTWEDAGDEVKPTKIWAKFEKHLAPKVKYRLARFQLQDFRQGPEESIDNFIARCRNKAAKCKFRDTEETEVRLIEQLIKGTKHKKVQERLLGKDEALTLDKAIDISRTYEATMTHLQVLHNQSKDPGNTKKEILGIDATKKTRFMKKCRYCGGHHLGPRETKCSAFGSTCKKLFKI